MSQSLTRTDIRQLIRAKRREFSPKFQQQESEKIVQQLINHPALINAKTVALYLANDGELDLSGLIDWCWQNDKQVYLPIIHPFSSKHLLFTLYSPSHHMVPNKFGILEPKLNQTEILPVSEFGVIFTPLVAFDSTGARLGMGGGFYDRTLASVHLKQANKATSPSQSQQPLIIGLAHDCQQVPRIPVEPWDIPIPEIVTPTQRIIC